ncbi:uncharacterized protein L969DRAFT_68597 [Mixia osmundae IAM 14324]|uniref:Phytase-like domain-containing protein n=1 Tax=Mixia osmundae (strain CBS 9802 / IAM 14324 / JCM 22182 / KY 12970) TaxID=764103 RepID=G7E3X2_MIXOS|nr:uncharacterized protein L969DRAFT_68597 [Mixia osmundae IAM 14324]KEI41977.1 hypothetical protein L969DRAFT_68597 [Mixia osmundae IAM 14324]GAA97532.1 hypothetical protein E5Q_04210 [Mixia osmundae IAM 14324]
MLALGFVLAAAGLAASAPAATLPQPDPSLAYSVTFNGVTYVNKGLVGYGSISASALDQFGDTLGGLGSAIAISPKSFRRSGNRYAGALLMQPDRGHNTQGTVAYPARVQAFSFVFTPYYATANQTLAQGGTSLPLNYLGGQEYQDREVSPRLTTGLDPNGIRPAFGAVPELPIATSNLPYGNLTFDSEGIAFASDGSHWVSDEYGPAIYHVNLAGVLTGAILPPAAIVPMQNGKVNFTALVDPTTGRVANQGFEGLTITPDNTMLYTLLQSATVQDGGSSNTKGRYTRLLGYNIANVNKPALVEEYIVPLPTSSKGKVYAASEVAYVAPNTFLVLARDGNGDGDTGPSKYKSADLMSTAGATNIANTAYDSPATPAAPGGVLSSAITPATYQAFTTYINGTQLARFGLNNGATTSPAQIDGKWESLSLVSVLDPAYPDDYFLFTASDNDFITTNGTSGGVPYQDPYGSDVPTQVFVFRLTLPGANVATYTQA